MVNSNLECVGEWMTVAQVAQIAPGGPFHHQTIRKWINTGIRGIRLEAVRAGGRICISRQALERFCDRCTSSKNRSIESIVPSAARVSKRNLEIEQSLRLLGFVL